MSDKDGGSAFPEVFSTFQPQRGDGGVLSDVYSAGGMTLRDYFAGKAMQALIAKSPHVVLNPIQGDPETKSISESTYRILSKSVALGAYDYADAMLKERAK